MRDCEVPRHGDSPCWFDVPCNEHDPEPPKPAPEPDEPPTEPTGDDN